jgi:hypothetical protein
MSTGYDADLNIPRDRYDKIRLVVEYTEYTMNEVIMALFVIALRTSKEEMDLLGLTEIVQTVKAAIEELDLAT